MKLAGWLSRPTVALASSSVVGQGISLLSVPVLSRLYSPSQFGVLAVYMASLALASSVACLRLDITIPMRASDAEASGELRLALRTSVASGVAAALVMLLYVAFSGRRVSPELWLLPPGIALTGLYTSLQAWHTRARRFKELGATRIAQATAGATAQVLLGFAGAPTWGLVLGHVLFSSAGVVRLASLARVDLSAGPRAEATPSLRIIWPYVRSAVPEALLLGASMQAPLLVVAAFAGEAEAGALLIATRLIGTPATLVSSAVGQVYLSESARAYRSGALRAYTLGVLRRSAKYGLAPFLLLAGGLALFAPLILGSSWNRTANLVAWLTPGIALQFLVAPISTVIHVLGRHAAALSLQIAGATLRIVLPTLLFAMGVSQLSETFALGQLLFYALYLSVVLWCLKAHSAGAT